jgi:hypothetical protein
LFKKNISRKGAILKIPLGRKIVFEILFAFRHDMDEKKLYFLK